jgi:hypothetical protein
VARDSLRGLYKDSLTYDSPLRFQVKAVITLPNEARPEPYSIVVALFSWVVLHVPIKSYDLVINNTKSMNMDKTGITSSLLSSWFYIIPKPEPIIATK